MNYILTLSTPMNPQTFSIAFANGETAQNALDAALESQCLHIGDFVCLLGPGCSLRLAREDYKEGATLCTNGVTHYLVVSMPNRELTLSFPSEGAADNVIADAARKGYIEDHVEERCSVYVFTEPGTCFLKLTAPEYDKLRAWDKPTVEQLKKIILA